MHVLVRVQMRQPDARPLQPRDLRRELALDVVERHAPLQAGDDERLPRRAKPSIVCDERWNVVGRERGGAVHEREVHADTERRAQAAARDLVFGGRRVREEAGARENAEVVRVENPFVHPDGEPEIVGVHDELALHRFISGILKTCSATRSPMWICVHGWRVARRCSTSRLFSNVTCSSCTSTHVSTAPAATPCDESPRTEISGRPSRCKYRDATAGASVTTTADAPAADAMRAAASRTP